MDNAVQRAIFTVAEHSVYESIVGLLTGISVLVFGMGMLMIYSFRRKTPFKYFVLMLGIVSIASGTTRIITYLEYYHDIFYNVAFIGEVVVLVGVLFLAVYTFFKLPRAITAKCPEDILEEMIREAKEYEILSALQEGNGRLEEIKSKYMQQLERGDKKWKSGT